MTAQEKWVMTIRCMETVRANYHMLRGDKPPARIDIRRRQRIRSLYKWRDAIDDAYRRLRSRRGKSAARARHDWLTARMLSLMVYEAASPQTIRVSLAPGREVHERFSDALMQCAIKAVVESAEEKGLFG